MELLQTIFATILTLGLLVTIHEWGHFIVARLCSVRVLRFSVGFGSPLLSWNDRKGTEYVIAAIPLGGYVKMLDEREGDVPADQLQETFNRKPVLQRIAIVAAGPVVNLIFAVFAYWIMFISGVSTVAPMIGGIQEGTPAASAGVPEQGEIISIDGYRTLSWEEVNLRLASRVGDSGDLLLRIKDEESSLPIERRIVLDQWQVDMETQSPVSALGLEPWSPAVPAVIGRLLEDGRGLQSGLMVGDHVERVNETLVIDWRHLVDLIQENPESAIRLQVVRANKSIELEVIPAAKVDAEGRSVGFIGAGVAAVSWPTEYRRVIQYGVIDAVGEAFDKTEQMIVLTLESIGKMIEGVISVKNLSGPITIAKVAGASAASGLEPFISFLAYLSISLGILNLLPIPVLDGGHLLYYLVELVTGRPVSEKIQNIGLKIGMAVLLSLMFVAFFNDLMRL